MTVIDWLLDSDPAIRWQVMRDLTDAPADEVAAERARSRPRAGARGCSPSRRPTANGPAAPLPEAARDDLQPDAAARLRARPRSAEARRAIALVREHSRWEHDDQPYFEGEVEPCINGRAVTIGAYFGEDVRGIVDRLLSEQMADGGWNCEQESGSTRGSFDTTINVLEGLARARASHGRLAGGGRRARPRSGVPPRASSAPPAVDRRDHRPDFTRFSFPTDYYYDVLRGARLSAAAPT